MYRAALLGFLSHPHFFRCILGSSRPSLYAQRLREAYGMGTGTEKTISVYKRRSEELMILSIQGKAHVIALGRISGAQDMSVMGTYSPDVDRQTWTWRGV